ncbi:aspartyl protease family protein [Brevundimonas mediterranea]|uniref:Serine protease Do n=1 Tax=Brevundimonas mediterranea TaxID=74329 RepID=A0A7W6EZ37_9CAUL|nr:aspartyl protease family protein [Brevundimonas mediterranea]MBB3871616.1 serine protease Do [Brevundimonas mediterranea]
MSASRRQLLALTIALGGASVFSRARAQTSVIEAPIRLENGRVLMDVTLNGAGPFPFALDTGAEVAGLRLALAQRLGLRELRRIRLGGAMFPFYGVSEMVFGGAVRQTNAGLFGLEGRILGAEGLLAAGLLTSMDSELLFEAGLWRVHPSGGPDRTGFTRLDGAIEPAKVEGLSARPFAKVDLNGQTERVVLDTGGPRPLSLSRKRAETLGLWSDALPFAPIPHSNILGRSPEPSRLVRAPRLAIGPAIYENVLVALNAAENIGGETILGLPIIQTLDLSIARADNAIWVRRNGLKVTEPTYGLSGLWLSETRGGVRVDVVGAGSPAAAADVRVGDILLDVSNLREGIDRVGGAAGREVGIRLRRGGETVEAAFTQSAYL